MLNADPAEALRGGSGLLQPQREGKINGCRAEAQETGKTVVVSFATAGGGQKWEIPLRTLRTAD